jgi:hypothetical protein
MSVPYSAPSVCLCSICTAPPVPLPTSSNRQNAIKLAIEAAIRYNQGYERFQLFHDQCVLLRKHLQSYLANPDYHDTVITNGTAADRQCLIDAFCGYCNVIRDDETGEYRAEDAMCLYRLAQALVNSEELQRVFDSFFEDIGEEEEEDYGPRS